MKQTDFTTRPLAPFQLHSPTSHDAAKAVDVRATTLRAKVLACIKAHEGGLTDEEIQTALNMAGSTQRPRRVELLAKGLIRQAGERKCRSGRLAAVWSALEAHPDA